MKNSTQASLVPSSKGITRREGLMLTVLGSALALAGCGGGGSDGGTTASGGTAAGTGSSATGAITGFGSIIVGGVRFDDSAASVQDDDGASMSSGDLKLGMVVRIKGGKKTDDGTSIRAKADSIEVHSELQGPVDSKTATSIVVLGQTVKISATTFFDDGLTLATLAVGNVVEVHGFVDPLTNTLTATRIELKPNAKVFKLQGAISALNTAAKTFSIGTLTISYLTAVLPSSLTLANGSVVRVRLAITPLTGTRTALKVQKFEIEKEDRNEAEVEGIITAFTSTALFSVNGLPVNAGAIVVPAGVKLGARVEVEGSIVNGVLVAKKVELEDGADAAKFELHGTVSLLDTTAKTFVLRGVKVNYTSATTFSVGVTALTLANGLNLEVKGARSDANVIVATRISLEK
jgi:hypothetical protein